jgi:hypothetical protein
VVAAETVIGGSLPAVWGAFSQYRFRTAWWSELMVDAYVGGEVIVSWDEGVGRVVDCLESETLTMAWVGNPSADYWRERLEAWRVYVEAPSSSIQP